MILNLPNGHQSYSRCHEAIACINITAQAIGILSGDCRKEG
ncbi:MAG: hypothetical protein ACRC8Y_04350 [Chroococcales cyanobacterium]